MTRSLIEHGIKAPLASLNLPWKGVWLAGGALRCMYLNEPIKDYDLVFDSPSRLDDFRRLCDKRGWKHEDKKNQTSVKIDGRMFDASSVYIGSTLPEILSKYDLTNSLLGCSMSGEIYIDERCQYAMDTRSFRIANVIRAGSTLQRIHKFLGQGWRADYPNLQDLWIDYIMKLQANKYEPKRSRTRL